MMDDKLLKRFFAGECSEKEQERVISWYRSGKAEKELSDQIEAYWKTMRSDQEVTWEKEEVFSQLLQDLPEQPSSEKFPKSGTKALTHKTAFSFAASVALLLICATLWYIFTKGTDVKPSILSSQFIQQETARGEKTQFVLPDGTEVIMNADSRIWYREDFGSVPERVIHLEGEAFFDVAKDSLRPFTIHSREIITTVLGTTFNVQAFAEEDIIVSVVTGKVAVEKPLKAMYLESGEQAIYGLGDQSLSKDKFDTSLALAWKDGTLYFKNERFADVVKKLERWYGVSIEVQKTGIEDGFTGSYQHKSIDAVVEGIGFVLGFDYEIKDNQVVIK